MIFKIIESPKEIEVKRKTINIEVPDKKNYEYSDQDYYDECFDLLVTVLDNSYEKYLKIPDYINGYYEFVIQTGKWKSNVTIEIDYCPNCGTTCEFKYNEPEKEGE